MTHLWQNLIRLVTVTHATPLLQVDSLVANIGYMRIEAMQ
jgi:hypothetical protein